MIGRYTEAERTPVIRVVENASTQLGAFANGSKMVSIVSVCMTACISSVHDAVQVNPMLSAVYNCRCISPCASRFSANTMHNG